MTNEERQKVARAFLEKCLEELQRKGEGYTVGDDVNGNFAVQAALAGGTPAESWLHGFAKHLTPIIRHARGLPEGPESISHRLMDAINYLLIRVSMLQDSGEIDIFSSKEVEA